MYSSKRLKFNIKKPKPGKRASFALVKQVQGRTAETIKDERIAAINEQYKKGTDFATCLAQIQDIKNELLKEEQRKRPQRVRLRENMNLFEKFWKANYTNRDLVDFRSAKNDFLRAVEGMGETPLMTAPQEELQTICDGRWKKQKHRRMVRALNQILKFIRPNVKLRKAKLSFETPRHLSEKEFQQVITQVQDKSLKALWELAFYSGLRIGELMALTPRSRRGEIIDVVHQIDRDGNRRDTKNRLQRKAYLLPQGVGAFDIWVEVKNKEDYRESRELKVLCQKLFKGEPVKHCSIHGLRHSYAIHLLSLEASLTHVAQSLGNSISVCQRHYTGFVLTDESIEALSRTVKRRVS